MIETITIIILKVLAFIGINNSMYIVYVYIDTYYIYIYIYVHMIYLYINDIYTYVYIYTRYMIYEQSVYI